MKTKLINLVPGQIEKLLKKRKDVLKKSGERLGIEIGGGIVEHHYPCFMDDSFNVCIIDKNGSDMWKELFEIAGVAFIFGNTKYIMIDSAEVYKESFTLNHLYAVEAHEICHYLFEHHNIIDPVHDKLCEQEADLGAVSILKHMKRPEAVAVIEKRYQSLYENHKDFKLRPDLQKKLDIYIKEEL